MLRAGIIGAGRIAWGLDDGAWDGTRSVTHAACLNRHPDTQLVALFDPIADSRAAFQAGYKGPSAVPCHSDLIRFFDEGFDLVVIASPSDHHCDHVLACFDAGIPHLMIEKPVTLIADDFQAVRQAHGALATKPAITVNYFRRFLPQVAALKAHLQDALRERTAACLDVTYSRDLSVNGVHLLDVIGHLFDATTAPDLEWCARPNTPDPSFGFVLNGVPVTVTGVPDLGYHALDMRLTTQSGQMILARGGLDLLHAPKVPNPDYPGFFHLDPPTPALPVNDTRAAMVDGTYLALCDLVNRTDLSPLDQSGFAQSLLANVQKATL